MSNPIKTIIDASGLSWRYYSGSFWAVTKWQDKPCLIAAPALADGNIDISEGEINACDVEECEQHHLDFVKEAFGISFELQGATKDNPIGKPVYFISNFY